MAIRLLPNGVFEFDTVDEAMQFQALSAKNNGACDRERPITAAPRNPSGADFDGFFDALSSTQKELLRRITTATGTLTAELLAQQAKVDSNQLGPMLRHLRAKAERYHIDPDRLISSKKQRLNAGERMQKIYTTRYTDEIKARL